MISQKVTYTSVIAAIAVASLAMVSLLQTQTTAQSTPLGNNVYVFAEGVYPRVTFGFKEATVTYDFQGFTQVSNLFETRSGGVSRPVAPEFTLQRIVGETPYLHEAVDQTWQYQGRATPFEYPYKLFDVTVEMIQAGKSLRTFKYADCQVTNYKVTAEFDKEEGYTTGGKTGFALLETYTFICNGYNPVAVTYDELIKEKQNGKPYE